MYTSGTPAVNCPRNDAARAVTEYPEIFFKENIPQLFWTLTTYYDKYAKKTCAGDFVAPEEYADFYLILRLAYFTFKTSIMTRRVVAILSSCASAGSRVDASPLLAMSCPNRSLVLRCLALWTRPVGVCILFVLLFKYGAPVLASHWWWGNIRLGENKQLPWGFLRESGVQWQWEDVRLAALPRRGGRFHSASSSNEANCWWSFREGEGAGIRSYSLPLNRHLVK